MGIGSQAGRIIPAPFSTEDEHGREFTELECNDLSAGITPGRKGGSGRFSGMAGFSLIEILVVLLIMGIVTMIALPSAMNSIKGYKLHSDATAVASYLNVVRMKAASQYAPYRLVVNTTAVPATYVMERLCGNTPSSSPGDPTMNPAYDASCTGPYASYQPFTTAQLEGGTQYISQGNSFYPCRPASITGTTYPGTIVGNPSPCTGPVYMYFNTRGSPVDYHGNPLGNGGAVLYIEGQNGLIDGVTVSLGGRVATYMWSGSGWGLR